MKIDFHAHTIFSDGIETPERIVQQAKKCRLDGIAITDHDSIKGWERAVAEGKRVGLSVVTGKEIKIRENKRTIGELLALFIEEDVVGNTPGEIVDAIRSQGGIVAIAHPFDPWIKFSKNPIDAALHLFDPWRKSRLLDIIEENKINLDAIEVMNGRNAAEANKKSKEYAKQKNLSGIAGSDAHWIYEVGNCYTVANTESLEAFRKAIKNKKIRIAGKQKSILEISAHRLVCKCNTMLL